MASPELSFGTLQPPSSSSAVSLWGEGHVPLRGGCSPAPQCGQGATDRMVEQGQAVCQHLGMSPQPWKQLPRVLPSAAKALLCLSTGGAVSFCWGSSWCHEGGPWCSPISVGSAGRLDPSLWSQEQCPSELPPPVALSGLMMGCPEQRAVLSTARGCLLCASSAL